MKALKAALEEGGGRESEIERKSERARERPGF